MHRTAALVVAFAALVAAPSAWAGDPAPPPPPTKDQLDAAKQAFKEGNALYKEGKFAEAVERLRESYRLSHNAVLLYNIGHIQEQAGHEDQALFYYRKFLAEAAANAPMHAEVVERVAQLEAESITASADPDAPPPVKTTPEPSPAPKIEIQHQLVEAVPPGLPIDITATVPADANLTLTLSYRTSGEAAFTKLSMFARGGQLIARIPAARVAGKQVQYFLEAKDAAGTLVTRSGRSTAPNLVDVDATAKPHYDATMNDDGTDAPVTAPVRKPLPPPVPVTPVKGPEGELITVARVKWVSTGLAGALLGTSIVSYMIAGAEHDKLVRDSTSCGTPPCREFDVAHDQKLQSLGERYDTVYKVTLGVGIGVAAVAGYFWYRDLTNHHHDPKIAVTPTIDPSFAGVAAAGRF